MILGFASVLMQEQYEMHFCSAASLQRRPGVAEAAEAALVTASALAILPDAVALLDGLRAPVGGGDAHRTHPRTPAEKSPATRTAAFTTVHLRQLVPLKRETHFLQGH